MMANETAIDGGASWERLYTFPCQMMADGSGSPERMAPPEFDNACLHLGSHLMRTGRRPRGVIGKPGKTGAAIMPEPAVHRLPSDPVATGHIGDGGAAQDLQDRFVPLFH
jgi:hypothetical protein